MTATARPRRRAAARGASETRPAAPVAASHAGVREEDAARGALGEGRRVTLVVRALEARPY